MRTLHWHDLVETGQQAHWARVTLRVEEETTLHDHDFAEVFWVEQGQLIHRINDTEQVLAPGSLVLIRPADQHGLRCTDTDACTFFNLAIPRQTWLGLARRYRLERRWWWTADALPFQTRWRPADLAGLSASAERAARTPHSALALDWVVVDLLQRLADEGPASGRVTPDWLHQVLRQLDQPEHLTAGVAGLARLAARSPDHVNRAVRASFGKTATDLVNELRLDYVARQLSLSDADILDSAYAVGFHNVGHFYKLFRRRFGTTPRGYRRQYRQVLGGQ